MSPLYTFVTFSSLIMRILGQPVRPTARRYQWFWRNLWHYRCQCVTGSSARLRSARRRPPGPNSQIPEIEVEWVSVELDVDLRSPAEQGGIARKTSGVIAPLDRSVLHRPIADVVEETCLGVDRT